MKYFITTILISCYLQLSGQQINSPKIIAYYTGNGETIRQYPVGKLTHIIYSFLKLQNDTLTFQVAHPEDFWMHVGDYGGSHVVVRNPAKERVLPDNVLTKAAQLAAYFSQARNSSKVEVHYTQRRHVSKPRRAKPGLVKLSEFLSLRVEPKNWFDE